MTGRPFANRLGRGLLVAALVAAVVLSSFAICVVACGEIESVSVSVAPLSQPELDGLVERGWLAPFFPAPAEALVLRYDIDTNRRCARFSYSAAQLAKLQEAALAAGFAPGPSPAAPKRISTFKPCPFSETELREAVVLRRPFSHVQFYSEALAMSHAAGVAYFWDFIE